jgi:hypothetical protein
MADEPKSSQQTPAARDKTILFAFSMVLLVGLATVTWLNPHFTAQQWFINACILALAAGGFAAFLPGALEWQVSPQMRATGAIALVIFVLVLGTRIPTREVQARSWSLVTPNGSEPPNPDGAAVYVSLDDQIVKASGTQNPDFKVSSSGLGKEIDIQRGNGGIVVHVPRAASGQRLFIIVEDQGKWWISNDVRVPPTDRLELRETDLQRLRRRIQ